MFLKQTCSVDFETKDGTKYRLRGLHYYEGKKSIHQIVQNCKLQLPTSVIIRNNNVSERVKLISKIAEGDKVSIYLGYNGKNQLEFTGYLKKINYRIPVEIEIEDEMYLLRKVRLKKTFKKADIEELVDYIIAETKAQVGLQLTKYENMPKCDVFNYWMNNANPISVFQDLEDKYLLTTFLLSSFINTGSKKILYCGLLMGHKSETVNYRFNKNTASIDELKFSSTEQTNYKVVIIHIGAGGISKRYEFGDRNGIEHPPVRLGGYWSEASIKNYAEGLLKKLQVGGYRGSLTTLLIPNVVPTMVANCKETQFVERTGNYYIGTVTTTFGSGATRKPEIEIRL